ncbi:MAG TPA: nucleotidyltransferase family protein [Gemmatimonadaceae bacterium]|nr:nucleotidyltransferase family protein [Gemmatimonadaceae bacterium]
MHERIETAVVLAAGRGTRMQRRDDSAHLTPEQARAADSGSKAMIPVGRPMLDYILSALADAGIRRACIVIRAGDDEIPAHYARAGVTRLELVYAEQSGSRGTADAILSAREAVGNRPFLMLNGDNYYPVSLMRSLAGFGAPAVAAFDRAALIRESNIAEDRIRAYALLKVAADGTLEDIIEKPDPTLIEALGASAPVSMNLWAFPPAMFDACARVKPSPRGELELQDAVRLLIANGEHFRLLATTAGVLDLSNRGDIPVVTERLRTVDVQL